MVKLIYCCIIVFLISSCVIQNEHEDAEYYLELQYIPTEFTEKNVILSYIFLSGEKKKVRLSFNNKDDELMYLSLPVEVTDTPNYLTRANHTILPPVLYFKGKVQTPKSQNDFPILKIDSWFIMTPFLCCSDMVEGGPYSAPEIHRQLNPKWFYNYKSDNTFPSPDRVKKYELVYSGNKVNNIKSYDAIFPISDIDFQNKKVCILTSNFPVMSDQWIDIKFFNKKDKEKIFLNDSVLVKGKYKPLSVFVIGMYNQEKKILFAKSWVNAIN